MIRPASRETAPFSSDPGSYTAAISSEVADYTVDVEDRRASTSGNANASQNKNDVALLRPERKESAA
jgi:hypothetical protein